jgi:hypothetical protein
MPEQLSTTLQQILALDEFYIQGYFVLVMPDNTIFRFATDEITISGNSFENFIEEFGEINNTLENPIDNVPITIQNLDITFINKIVSSRNDFKKATVSLGEYYYNKDKSLIDILEVFYGKPFNPKGNDSQLSFTVISPFDDGSTYVADRTLNDLCSFIYKDVATCGSTDVRSNCNKRRGVSDGCNIDHRFGGWEFPDEQTFTPPGGGDIFGGGDDGGGIGTCPSVEDFVFTAPDVQKRANLVQDGDILWNPVTKEFDKVIKAEIIPNQKLLKIFTANGCISRSSETHKLLTHANDDRGTPCKDLQIDDNLLTYKDGFLEISNIIRIKDCGFGDVMLIELEHKHLYVSGMEFNKGIVAHNNKTGDIILTGGEY